MKSTGTCLCRAVEYVANGEAVQVLNCHCPLCRKMNGSAFSTYVVIPAQHVRIVQGESSVVHHAVTERASRHFCKHCGTAIFNSNPTTYPGLYMLYLGTLHNASQLTPAINIYCDSKLTWIDGIKDMKNFAEAPRRKHPASAISSPS